MQDFIKTLGVFFGGIVAFVAINSFLYALEGIERWDYILANALFATFKYLLYLTTKVQRLEKLIR